MVRGRWKSYRLNLNHESGSLHSSVRTCTSNPGPCLVSLSIARFHARYTGGKLVNGRKATEDANVGCTTELSAHRCLEVLKRDRDSSCHGVHSSRLQASCQVLQFTQSPVLQSMSCLQTTP